MSIINTPLKRLLKKVFYISLWRQSLRSFSHILTLNGLINTITPSFNLWKNATYQNRKKYKNSLSKKI